MGSFILTKVDINTTYFARIKSKSDGQLSNLYPLPRITLQGNVLSVIENRRKILTTGSANYLRNDRIYVRASCRAIIYYDIKGQLQEGVLRFSLPSDKLPEGIISFTDRKSVV